MIKKVAFLFWGLIPILLVYILFTFNDYIDINIQDTYVAFPKYLVVVLVILLFFTTGLGYYLAYYSEKFTPVKVLTIFHVILLFTGNASSLFFTNF